MCIQGSERQQEVHCYKSVKVALESPETYFQSGPSMLLKMTSKWVKTTAKNIHKLCDVNLKQVIKQFVRFSIQVRVVFWVLDLVQLRFCTNCSLFHAFSCWLNFWTFLSVKFTVREPALEISCPQPYAVYNNVLLYCKTTQPCAGLN